MTQRITPEQYQQRFRAAMVKLVARAQEVGEERASSEIRGIYANIHKDAIASPEVAAAMEWYKGHLHRWGLEEKKKDGRSAMERMKDLY